MKTRGEGSSMILGFLRTLPLFSCLSETSLQTLSQECRIKVVEKGDMLFFQSDPCESAYVVQNGNIAIILNSPDGREMVINEMQSGDFFGELGILTRKTRSTSAIAQTKSELYVIPSQTFLKVIEKEPHFAFHLLEMTARRLQRSGERESALAFLDAQARLARLLLELENQEHEKGYVTISQEELAHRTGLIRQTVAKALGKWRRAGWLITGRGRILILNKKALQDLENRLLV